MNFIKNLQIAVRNLKKRKGRGILTALGVVIGISSVLAIISLGDGLQVMNEEQFKSMGNIGKIQVYPKSTDTDVGSLSVTQVTEIEGTPGVEKVIPNLSLRGSADISYSYYQVPNSNIQGIYEADLGDYDFEIIEGQYPSGSNEILLPEDAYAYFTFTNDDESEEVITLPSMTELLGREIEITQKETVKDTNGELQFRENINVFVVSGIIKNTNALTSLSLGSDTMTAYTSPDNLDLLQSWYESSYLDPETGEITYPSAEVILSNNDDIDSVTDTLKKENYSVVSFNTLIDSFNQIFLMIKIILSGIAGIALLVAMINIMNTMYTSVLERKKEIGVMKVLGAPITAIQQMFLLEAGFIGFAGGLTGILLGELLTLALGNLLSTVINIDSTSAVDFPFQINYIMIGSLLVLSTVIGMLAGYLPARRAARTSPIEAIRNE